MSSMNATEIAETIQNFLASSKNPALFAGAGIGVRAGLPTWPQFMEHLAMVAKRYDPLTGDLIHQRSAAGHFLSAAVVYKTCPQIPRGELYEQLGVPFRSPSSTEKLNALVSLPFLAIFTTNYDRSLLDAYASVTGKSPITVELNDPTMIRAPYLTDFYIARIHGRSEVPDTIVFSEDDYKRLLDENECYIDFVRHILTRYSCLFLGFSFVDPAIENILRLIETRLSPNFPKLHLAILPTDSGGKLKSKLARFNIRVEEYDAHDQHSLLWEGITLASRSFDRDQKTERQKANFPLNTVRQFVATSYARAKLEDELQPLRDIVIDGIVLDILNRAGDRGSTILTISNTLQHLLSLPEKQCCDLVQRRIEVLSGRGLCQVRGKTISPNPEESITLAEDIKILVDGVINRAEVREGQLFASQFRKTAAQCVEETLLARSWDLGAHYAGAINGEMPGILSTVKLSVEKYGAKLSPQQKTGLAMACYDLFQNPDEIESGILAELGRVAFALQLVINNPCSIMAHQAVLPERVYLDASFVMPAEVEGHPYKPLYSDALNRFREASKAAGITANVVVAEEFLNEIISHRAIAQREVQGLSLGNSETIDDYILYQGIENVNVFIGAYAHWVGRLEKKESFEEFLNTAAPYNSEKELSTFLGNREIQTLSLSFRPGDEMDLYYKIRKALTDAYEADTHHEYERKERVLIEHEARQLTKLTLDLDAGLRPLFVTADMRLRRLATGPVLGKAGMAIISHRGLVQLIDMLIGVKSDPVVTARLFWGSIVTDDSVLIRDYLVNKALSYQDEAMAMSLTEVLQNLVPKEVEAAKRENISLFPGSGGTKNKIRRVRFLSGVENRFYANMAEVIHQRYPDEYNIAVQIRRDHLQKHIKSTFDLIYAYETKLRESDDPKEKANCKRELAEMRMYLDEYEKELNELPQQ
jgi:hypothetical protein